MVKAASVRSGLVESLHDWSAVLVVGGTVERTWGDDVDRPMFARSTVKPIQATVAQELGADLAPEQMAVACASHSGTPAQLALVDSMLDGVGLTVDALRCPASLPYGDEARRRWHATGGMPTPLAHNCSGKHAAFLCACLAQGWDIETYVDPQHPLQQLVIERIAALTEHDPGPIGVDGCGSVTPRVTLTGLARAFARLCSDAEHTEAATAMTRYPALTADNLRNDGQLAMWWPGPVKVGAEGLIVMGRHDTGLAVKSWEGSRTIAVVGAVAAARGAGLLEPHVAAALAPVSRPAVLGGGRVVGHIEPDVTAIDEKVGVR